MGTLLAARAIAKWRRSGGGRPGALQHVLASATRRSRRSFSRLADYKTLQAQGKNFGVLGCVAQQEGEKIFERAPHVSLVCGSASYRKLPEMLAQLEEDIRGGCAGDPTPRGCAAPGLKAEVYLKTRVFGSSPLCYGYGREVCRTGNPRLRAWCALLGLDRPADRPSALRPNSPRAPIRIAATSRSSGLDKFARSASCRSRVGKSASRASTSFWRRRGGSPIYGCSAKSGCSGRTWNSYRDP